MMKRKSNVQVLLILFLVAINHAAAEEGAGIDETGSNHLTAEGYKQALKASIDQVFSGEQQPATSMP